MWRLFVFALLFCPGISWELETTHEQVIVGFTKNVTLECIYGNDDNGKPRMADVFDIRIRKFQGNDKRTIFAMVRINFQTPILGKGVGPDVSVKGHAQKVNNSFLSITWPMPSSNTTGQYICEINGYADDDELVQVETIPLSIHESRVSTRDLLSIISDLKTELTKEFHEDLVMLRKDVSSEIVNVQQELQNETAKLREDIPRDKLIQIVDSKIQENLYEKRKWPGGQYGMLNSESGCPNSTTSVWKSGRIKFRSESSQQSSHPDAVSQPNHFVYPVLVKNGTNNYVYLHTCKRATNSSGPAWPKGSYCIHRVGGFCPTGFEQSSVQIDSEDNVRLIVEVTDAPDLQVNTQAKVVVFFFCCRRDGSPHIPIVLPIDIPFYLYRHKGICQSVSGAKVSDEWLQIDTEHTNNGDRYLTRYFPDSTLSPVQLFLCYYAKIS